MPAMSHLGQPALNHVVLEVVAEVRGGYGAGQFEFIRLMPDGNSVQQPFRVPQDQLLIITEVDWQYSHPNHEAAAGQIEILRLLLQPLPSGQSPGVCVFESPATLGNKGEGGTSQSMTTGFVVSPHARICPEVIPGPTGPQFGLKHIILRGYVLPTNGKGRRTR
jgi:hypothetical protein